MCLNGQFPAVSLYPRSVFNCQLYPFSVVSEQILFKAFGKSQDSNATCISNLEFTSALSPLLPPSHMSMIYNVSTVTMSFQTPRYILCVVVSIFALLLDRYADR